MKKILAKIIVSLLAVVMSLAAVGCSCSSSNWSAEDVTLKEWGAVVKNSGFVSETENYFYYVNGKADATADNSFGTPVKGALMAVKKTDLSEGKADPERCIVVPKLFVAQDYSAGIFISGDYVYYATPSTDRDSSGKIANSELEFARTKLDGTDTTTFFKTQAITDNYRFVEKDDVVYAVVYDSANTRLISYNTQTGAMIEVAKADVKTSEMETFDSATFKFVDRENCEDAVVVFTNTVYTKAYDQAEADVNSSYTRDTADYNKLYTYTVGDEKATLRYDGEDTGVFFNVKYIENGTVYYSESKTVTIASEETKAIPVSELVKGTAGVPVLKASALTDTALMISPLEVYSVNTESGVVRRTNVLTNDGDSEKTVAIINASSALVDKQGDYLYYVNGETKLARIKIGDAEAKEQVISASTVPTDWFDSEILGGYAFYSDTSALGCTYIKAVSLADANLKEEDEKFFFDKVSSLEKIDQADMVAYTTARIENITTTLENGKLVFDTDEEGKTVLSVSYVEETREIYDSLTDDQKEEVGEESLKTLRTYEEAVKLSKAFYGLDGFDTLTSDQKTALKDTAFATAKIAYQETLVSGLDVKTVRGYVVGDLNWYFQIATEFFK